ncbi:hypothetical protein K5D34_25580, partial [Pseudomonas cichorii]|nr:hypothetical protein [Pseudomonas cichorii]
QQPDGAALVDIELEGGAFVQLLAHQPGQVLQGKPDLGIQHHGAQHAVVADEDGGLEVIDAG